MIGHNLILIQKLHFDQIQTLQWETHLTQADTGSRCSRKYCATSLYMCIFVMESMLTHASLDMAYFHTKQFKFSIINIFLKTRNVQ